MVSNHIELSNCASDNFKGFSDIHGKGIADYFKGLYKIFHSFWIAENVD